MLRKTYLLVLTLFAGLYATTSSAQIFRLTLTPAGSMAPALAAALASEVQKIEDDINKGLPSASTPDRLMKGMANSSVMAGKGIGSDYASNMSVLLIGAGVGVGADLEKNKEADSPLSGAGVQGGLLLGTNLSWMDTQKILGMETSKLNVYANFMSFNKEMKSGDTDAKIGLASYGVHFSYDWIKGSGSKLLGWGGVKLHWGYEYNHTNLKFNSQIKKDLSYQDTTTSTGTYTSNILADPYASIDVTTHSIPLEISSSVQILYILSLYGGLGADYNVGSATGKGTLNSTPTTLLCNGACGVNANAGTITTDANIDGKGNANPFLYRGFAGVQFNLPFIRVFVQGDKAFGNDLVGATAGVRLVF
jgi:hypothetical protein